MSMAKFKKKLKAQDLRRRGFSIKEIAEELNVSKGSASVWCKEIILTKRQKKKLYEKMVVAGHKGRLKGAEVNHKRKMERISFHRKKGLEEMKNFNSNKKDLFMVGVGLYWGEGVKSLKSGLSFVNSDPDAILIMYRWFQEVFDIQKEEFMPRVFINEIHKERIQKVLQYWSALLQLPIEQFGNPVFLKTKQKKIYDNHDSYFGVLSLKIRKSTDLKYRIIGLIDALRES